MRVGFLQINPTVGAIEANARRLADGYGRLVAEGADLVLAPELCLTGYPPRDLVFKSAFVERTRRALGRLAEATGKVPFLVGHVDANDGPDGAPFLNAAAVLAGGVVAARRVKTRLPTYDVFDEARYFEPASQVEAVDLAGRRCGITICEDIWTDEYLPRSLYRTDPADLLAGQGVQMLFNLSASPYHLGKPGLRARMIGDKAAGVGLPVAYCNAVGANDQLVFDGHSLLVGADGRVIRQLPGFVEHEEVVDVAAGGCEAVEAVACEELHGALVLGVRDYVRKCGFKSVVLGLSGGIDSALVAALAGEALGPGNVTGVLMPGPYSSDHSVRDARALAAALGIRSLEVSIVGMYDAAIETLAPAFEGREPDITEENVQARLRGVTLMALSNKFGHLLLTTGNKSELAVGYCTIYGDMCGGLAVISDVPKTRVYELARWINREGEVIPWNTIEKPPSAELRPDQTDQDSLPPYEELDAILELLVERHASAAEIAAAGHDPVLVRRIIGLVDGNEWKRQQAAPGLRVTSKAFGQGRRMPIAQGFRDA